MLIKFFLKFMCSLIGHNYIILEGYDNIWDRKTRTNLREKLIKCKACGYIREEYQRIT